MTLEELLNAVPEAGLRVLNPAANLSRKVSGIDSSETPDIARYIEPDTLLLTTAMVYRDNQQGLAELIAQLDEARVAGIAIKLGRFISTLEPKVLEAADARKFPLLMIPPETTLGIVSHRLQSQIWGSETRQLHLALDIQKKISGLLFKGASLIDLLQYFSHLLKRDVLYYDYFFDLQASGWAGESSFRPLKPLARQVGAQLRALNQLEPFSGIEEFVLTAAAGEVHCIVSPIEVGVEYPHFLVVLYPEQVPDPYSYLVVEQAGNVFSFLAHNNRQLRESNWQERAGYFSRLLRIKSGGDGALRNSSPFPQGSSPTQLKEPQVITAGYDASNLPAHLAELDHFSLAALWLEKELDATKTPGVLVPLREQDHLVLLVQNSRLTLAQLLEGMAQRLVEHLPLRLYFGVGNQANSLEAVNPAYVEAALALRKPAADPTLSAVQFYSSEGIGELLQFVPDDHVRHYCLHVLGDLAYPDSETLIALRDTLQALLTCQCDIAQTSRMLFVHRNTVRYRMTKIQEMLARPLTDPDFTLQLRLALLFSQK